MMPFIQEDGNATPRGIIAIDQRHDLVYFPPILYSSHAM
jgi:hypothetical protein